MRRPFVFIPALILAGSLSPATAGTIYVADSGTIYKLSPTGVLSTFATGTGATNLGMAFDPAGDLFVNSRDSNAIYKVTPSGTVSTFATVSSPYALAVDASGDVFTSSPSSSRIIEYSPSGAASTFAADPGGYAWGLAVNPVNGYLFEDDVDGNIYEYSPAGARSTFASGVPGPALGLTFDQSGDLFSSDWSGHIFEFTPSGAESLFATYSNPTRYLATGLAYDYASNTLYLSEVEEGVATCCGQRVEAFNSAGVESTFATGLYNPFAIADFESQSAAPATPEPGSLYLLSGAALVAAARFRRR